MHNTPRNIGQPEVASGVTISPLFVTNPPQVLFSLRGYEPVNGMYSVTVGKFWRVLLACIFIMSGRDRSLRGEYADWKCIDR